ncbi:hypothetical protein EJ063_03690 [Vibrio aquaticus]|uniref:Uncharacterized protein n=1 Tax=Vibrio aquaticus TaxID=2496559 RepID=A0A432D1V1_9VIBR|nr:hypothetical protein EJ063_03690 [Vibrio aquaticus]
MDTIICRSIQSFIDLCDNNLIEGASVHCTFYIEGSTQWMVDYFGEKGGSQLSFTDQARFGGHLRP